jgi:hypothetical protein
MPRLNLPGVWEPFWATWVHETCGASMSEKQDRLVVRIFGLLAADAEGPKAVGALVLIVVLLTLPLWWR